MNVYRDAREATEATVLRLTEKVIELEDRNLRLRDELDMLRGMVDRLERAVLNHLRNCRYVGSTARALLPDPSARE